MGQPTSALDPIATKKIEDLIKELEYNTNAMIPCPGTFQYGNVVRVLNKDDFNKINIVGT